MSGKILVIGATGNVGAPLVAELLRRGEKVKAASRNAGARFPSGVEAVRLDLSDPTTLEPALSGVDRIYALSPAGSVDPLKRSQGSAWMKTGPGAGRLPASEKG